MANFAIDLETLLEAGVHFGHQARRWNPKMKSFIYTEKDGVHIFDLAKTAAQLEEACQKLFDAGKSGQTVVFVGTKRQAKEIVREHAIDAGANYAVTRWPAGLATNWEQVSRSIAKLNSMKKDREEGKFSKYTKYEQVQIDKDIARLERFFGGVADIKRIPDMIVVVDINTDLVALKEAKIKGIPTIGIADSNTDPDMVDLAVPGNDDAVGSIKLLVATLTKAFKDGRAAGRGVEQKAA